MADSDDPLFDPQEGIGDLRSDAALREQILADGWFPSSKPKGVRAKKGKRVTWLIDTDAKLVKVEPDQVIATPGNIFSAEKLATFAKMMRRDEIPFAMMPHGYIDEVGTIDIDETQSARADDLRYDGMTRPFMPDELGKTIVRLNAGNHRAFAAFMAGEPYIWVAIIDRGNPLLRNPARTEASDAADFIVSWARAGDVEYIANVIEAELVRFEKNANAPLIERPFRGADVNTGMSQQDLEYHSGINMVGGSRPAARAAAIRVVRAYGKVMGVPPTPTSIGYIAQLIELVLRGELSRMQKGPTAPSTRKRAAIWALDFINETRRQRHQRPLDADREGWTDDDILIEAERLQKNPSTTTELTADEAKLLGDAVAAYEDIVDEDIDEYKTRPAAHREIYRSLVKKIDRTNRRVAELTAEEETLLGTAFAAYEDIVDEDIDEYKTRPAGHRKIYRALKKKIAAMKAPLANPAQKTEAEVLAWYQERLDEALRLARHRRIALHVGYAARRELVLRYGLPGPTSFEDLKWLGYENPMAAVFAGRGPQVFTDEKDLVVFWAADPREAMWKWRAQRREQQRNPSPVATKSRLLAW